MPKFTTKKAERFTFLTGYSSNPHLTVDMKLFLIDRFIKSLGIELSTMTQQHLYNDVTGYWMVPRLLRDVEKQFPGVEALAKALDSLGFTRSQVAKMSGTTPANITYHAKKSGVIHLWKNSILEEIRRGEHG